jgi:hypothetical protein
MSPCTLRPGLPYMKPRPDDTDRGNGLTGASWEARPIAGKRTSRRPPPCKSALRSGQSYPRSP